MVKDKRHGMDFYLDYITIGTDKVRLIDQHTIGMISELTADEDNTGTIYLRHKDEDKPYPLKAGDVKVTRVDLYNVWVYASAVTQYLWVWSEDDPLQKLLRRKK